MTRKATTLFLSALIAINLCSCARKPSNPAVDPYENFNRVIFAFNQDIDHLFYRPVAKIYRFITPNFMQKGVSNVFDNVGELTTLPNDLLQGKVKYAFVDFWRFFINTTFGIGGLFDIASHMGLPKHHNDFGMTLAYWGGGNTKSPYLELPFLGPSTFRDTFGLPFNYGMSPYPFLHSPTSYIVQAARLINIRTKLLASDNLVDNAFDPYIFVRNAYLQNRNAALKENDTHDSVSTRPRPSEYR